MLLAAVPELVDEVDALQMLAGCQEALCYPVFARSTASGSLLRDKLEQVLRPRREAIAILLGGEGVTTSPRLWRRSSATRLPNWG